MYPTSDAERSINDDGYDQTRVPGLSLSIRSNPTKSQAATDVRAFEFISNEDEDGTRRAKSHAIKDFRRRQRLEWAGYQLKKQNSSRKKIVARSPPSVVDGTCRDRARRPTIGTTPPFPGSGLSKIGGFDPFNSLPVQLDSPKDLGLVHYCMSLWSHYYIAEC